MVPTPDGGSVLVHCEVAAGRLASLALEVLGAGRRLAAALGQELGAVLIGEGVAPLASEVIAHGADVVYVGDAALLRQYNLELYLPVLEEAIEQARPAILLLGHTLAGRELAPWSAFRRGVVASMDCVALEIDPDTKRLLTTRPVYGGNAQAVQVSTDDPQIATVRAKTMTPAARDEGRHGRVVGLETAGRLTTSRVRIRERKSEPGAGVKLEEARVVVAGGRGIGSASGFQQLEELAGLLDGAVGATRPPCDANWAAASQQIGITGRIVSPDLYLAVALSGASQHLAGCSAAKVIVAINKDPEANIFRAADYGIVDDWKAVVPALVSCLRARTDQEAERPCR